MPARVWTCTGCARLRGKAHQRLQLLVGDGEPVGRDLADADKLQLAQRAPDDREAFRPAVVDRDVAVKPARMAALQSGVIFDLRLDAHLRLLAEQRGRHVDHHDERHIHTGAIHVAMKVVAGLVDHAVEQARQDHVRRARGILGGPTLRRAGKERRRQEAASPDMAMAIDDFHGVSRRERKERSAAEQRLRKPARPDVNGEHAAGVSLGARASPAATGTAPS